MPTIDLVVNGRHHQVSCGEGQEGRLKRLGSYVDGRVGELARQHGQVGDGRLLLLTSLLIADELSDAYDEIKRLKGAAGDVQRQDEREAVDAMSRVAERLEQLAAALERA
ncbi:MAG TPA: cell division protein ZapA [Geminicoccaceae bacterium]|nr:cell division protein ZapA [Geminicoccaceae bacterium]